MTNQPLFPENFSYTFSEDHYFLGNIITDRGSKYSVSGGCILGSKLAIKNRLTHYLSDKYFQKASHNSYAYRYYDEEGYLIEGKNDDGETGAGQCILSQLQRKNMINVIIVVTRYFGGVQLHADRFRHVVDATKMFLEEYAR